MVQPAELIPSNGNLITLAAYARIRYVRKSIIAVRALIFKFTIALLLFRVMINVLCKLNLFLLPASFRHQPPEGGLKCYSDL